MKRSGLSLVLAGLLGGGLFWLTDPRWSPMVGHNADQALDAIHAAAPGTAVGLIGSAIVLLTGLWLLTRRRA